MTDAVTPDFPLFPLDLVALPGRRRRAGRFGLLWCPLVVGAPEVPRRRGCCWAKATVPDRKFSPANAPAAVRRFYGSDYELGPADVDPLLYEQWVSLETPAALLVARTQRMGPTRSTDACLPSTHIAKRLDRKS